MSIQATVRLALAPIMLLALATAAAAQVAAPRLNEISSPAQGILNGAVLPWNQGTIVGANLIPDITLTIESGGTSTEFASGEANILLLRSVGQTFAFSAERSAYTIDVDPAIVPDGRVEVEATAVALATKLGTSFTGSFAFQSGQETETFAGISTTTKAKGQALGATWRISDAFYLGGDYSMVNSDREQAGITASGDQSVARYGAAFYRRDDRSGFHVEVYRVDLGLIEVRDAAGTLVHAEQGEETGITLEFVGGDFLFSFERVKESIDELDPAGAPPLVTTDSSTQTLALGYMPKTGLVITLSKTDIDETESDIPADTVRFDITALGVAWRF